MRRARPVCRAAFLLLAMLPIAGCGEPPPDDRVPGPRLLEENVPEMVGTVTIREAGIEPSALTLETDQGFELTNEDSVPHRIQGRREEELVFDTGEMLPDETTVIVVNTAGTVVFSDRDDSDLRFEVVAHDPAG